LISAEWGSGGVVDEVLVVFPGCGVEGVAAAFFGPGSVAAAF